LQQSKADAVSVKSNITAICFDKKGRVLSVGKNSFTKTHPLQKKYADLCGLGDKIYMHAEVHAVVQVKEPENIDSILVTRFNKSGKPVRVDVCVICQSLLKVIGVKNIRTT
jgi:tRNA(Arg) A34 adenosine deaminase TadA